jgi:hypothetical protein
VNLRNSISGLGYHIHLFCADAQTGATLWADPTNRGNSAALIDAGEAMLAPWVNSELMALRPSGKEYAELARMKVAGTETWAHPAIARKRLFVRDRENVTLWVFDQILKEQYGPGIPGLCGRRKSQTREGTGNIAKIA